MNTLIQASGKETVKRDIEYNVSVLQLLRQFKLHSTDVAALYNIRSYQQLTDAIAALLVPEGGQEIESVSVAAELCAYPLFHFCFPNVISLPLTCVLLRGWRRLLIDLASEEQIDLPELISRTLHSICTDFPGLPEGMIGLLRNFLNMSTLSFTSLYSCVLRYKIPAERIITEAPLPVSVTTIPPLAKFQLYDKVLADHKQRVLQQVSLDQENSPYSRPSHMCSPHEVECMANEDDRSLSLRTKRAPSEAMLRAQNELTCMSIEDTISASLSATINEEHRVKKEEQDYADLVSQKLQSPTDILLESLRTHRQQLSDPWPKPSGKVNK
ncbi:Hypothetical protein GLP15_2544 [Giardia lamblia P15]|uniref:Uncharacterized protein n=1 Tax=Giardia intestinalis (strain P15) TaxID=658858 RepID=E1EXE0_GIAIA|nr:Hypothetical protein GLP15_2544 [Giardia lamblia P15]